MKTLCAALATVGALLATSQALAEDLPDPARTVVADCRDNGTLDGGYDLATLGNAEFQVLHANGGQPDADARAVWADCGAMIDEALQVALGPSAVPITDCMADGKLEGSYAGTTIQAAMNDLPPEWDEVTDCRGVLAAARDSATATAAAAPSSVTHALTVKGRHVAHRPVRVRALKRRHDGRWYGQAKWPTAKHGACYLEAIVTPVRGGTHTRTRGRYCKVR